MIRLKSRSPRRTNWTKATTTPRSGVANSTRMPRVEHGRPRTVDEVRKHPVE